jgi:hypothetical protein
VGTVAKIERHGNFFDAAYAAIAGRPDWVRRFNKIHGQKRALPKAERKWRELDSSMSSDALLMNVFCTPGVVESPRVRRTLGVDAEDAPVFGWKARVPLSSGLLDRTEVDMRLGGLLVEAKLTEGDFQTRAAAVVERYRDFDAVFERELLPKVELRTERQDGLKSLFFSGSSVRGGAGLWADAPLALAWLWGKVFSPAKPNAMKNAIYECGLESKGDAWMQFRSAYYLYAIIFLIFDVEAVFLLPFAVAFTGWAWRRAWPCWCLC